jgi:hypothetical protein
MTVNLVVPPGNERELCSHGQRGYVPFRVVDSAGKTWWLVTVDDQAARYFQGPGGFYLAPEALQSATPPGPYFVEDFGALRAGVVAEQGGTFAVVPIVV